MFDIIGIVAKMPLSPLCYQNKREAHGKTDKVSLLEESVKYTKSR